MKILLCSILSFTLFGCVIEEDEVTSIIGMEIKYHNPDYDSLVYIDVKWDKILDPIPEVLINQNPPTIFIHSNHVRFKDITPNTNFRYSINIDGLTISDSIIIPLYPDSVWCNGVLLNGVLKGFTRIDSSSSYKFTWNKMETDIYDLKIDGTIVDSAIVLNDTNLNEYDFLPDYYTDNEDHFTLDITPVSPYALSNNEAAHLKKNNVSIFYNFDWGNVSRVIVVASDMN